MTALQRPLTQRVRLGAYYTNGEYLAEVVEVHPLGSVSLVTPRPAQPTRRPA